MGPNDSGECQWELKRTIIEVEKKINQNEYKSLKIHRVSMRGILDVFKSLLSFRMVEMRTGSLFSKSQHHRLVKLERTCAREPQQ